jgi:uncharacterized protein (TIGR03435 family)
MRCATYVCAALFSLSAAPSQVATPRFEVASIKPNSDRQGRAVQFVPPSGGILMTHHSVVALVRYAYSLRTAFELAGVPDWAAYEQFDIRANPPSGTEVDDVPRMMKALLADRFKLRAHVESRLLPVFALVSSSPDARLGPDLTRSPHDCAAFFAAGRTLGSPNVPRDEHGAVACGTRFAISADGLRLTMRGVTASEIAHGLELHGGVDRPVVDRTGLSGHFDASVLFTPSLPVNGPSKDWTAPLLQQALQEQLGLKMESRRETRQILVVDSVERPTPD